MKHNLKITLLLISMFFVSQIIGLAVIYAYTPIIKQEMINGTLYNVTTNPLPYGMEPPAVEPADSLYSIIFAFIIAILAIFILTKFKLSIIMKLWFFIVVIIVVGITINAFLISIPFISSDYSSIIALFFAVPLGIYKVFKRNLIVHNITELMIYPGIAVVFVPLLNLWTIVILLVLISIYDMWAVWHSGIMQKMAKYQINELKIFAGFYVPYLNKKQRELIRNAKLNKSQTGKKTMKVNLAILGGGDVVFPIITSGVIFRLWGLIPALAVIICATLSLFGLFIFAKKGKFYPAMPFITAGLFIGILFAYLLSLLI